MAQDNNNPNNSLAEATEEIPGSDTKMESQIQALESKADSGSILNAGILTDADGKAAEGAPPGLGESFLKSLTCNFTFSAYVRAGFQFNGNDGGGNFSFSVPECPHCFGPICVYNGRRTVNWTVASNG